MPADAETMDRPAQTAAEVPDTFAASRRTALVAAGTGLIAAACTAPPKPPATTRPPTPPTTVPTGPPATRAAARHLANRATYGATAATVARIEQLGATRWIDEQLAPSALPDAEARLAGYVTLRQTNAQNDSVRTTDESLLLAELDHATLLRGVHSERQLFEVMCDFWTNHLNIWRRAKWLSQLKTVDNEQVVRRHALGRFSDLLMASAMSPAMLVYLDNFASQGQPGKQVNENYGRELLELHTLGIHDGVPAYAESDVVGVAKVLSGWSINWDSGAARYSFRFSEWWHCREPVSVFGGAWSRPSRADYHDRVANAFGDGQSLIRYLARHPSTARHLATKLARRFVADEPPPALVDRLAATYLAHDTAIAPVLRQLLLSTEFQASAGQKVKRPQDWLYSALRATRAQVHPAPKGAAATRLRSAASTLGQPVFERMSPDGWPERAGYWVAADGLLKRWEHAAKLARNTITDPGSAEKVAVDVVALLPPTLPATVRELLAHLAAEVCQYDLSSPDADAIATAARLEPTGPAASLAGNEELLRNALGLLLAHPSFQRR